MCYAGARAGLGDWSRALRRMRATLSSGDVAVRGDAHVLLRPHRSKCGAVMKEGACKGAMTGAMRVGEAARRRTRGRAGVFARRAAEVRSVRTSAQARRWMGKPADVCGYDEGTKGGTGSPGVMQKEYHLFAQ